MPSVCSAKRSAAMKMCIELHKIGELTDKLQPVTPESLQKDLSYLFPNWNDEDDSDKDLGTYKKKRPHQLQVKTFYFIDQDTINIIIYGHCLYGLVSISSAWCISSSTETNISTYSSCYT